MGLLLPAFNLSPSLLTALVRAALVGILLIVPVGGIGGHVGGHKLHLLGLLVHGKVAAELLPDGGGKAPCEHVGRESS